MARNKEKPQHAQQELDPELSNGLEIANAGTLAGASDQSLQKFLGRRQAKANERSHKKPSQLSAGAAGILPRHQNLSSEDAVCGAPAGNLCEEEEELGTAKPSGRSRVEDEVIKPPPWQPADLQLQEDDYEDEEDEEDWELADAFDAFDETPKADAGLVISLADGNKQEEVGKQRRKYTKEEIFAAARVHECHTLCLISRGHMLDVAASDPLVQAASYSLVPESVLKTFPTDTSKLKAHSLADIVHWFQKEVKATDVPQTFSAEEEAQLREEGGISASISRLQGITSEKSGSSEELVALFVALLRAAGLLVRFVRALDPLPWRPSMSELMVPQHRKQQRRRQAVNKETTENGKSGKARKPKKATKAGVVNGEKKGGASKGTGRKRRRTQDLEADQDWSESEIAEVKKEQEALTSKASEEQGSKQGRGGSRKKGGGRGKKEANESDAMKMEHEGIPSMTAVKQEEAVLSAEEPSKKPRKAKGDIEFENQLAMAMLSSTASASLAEQDAPNAEQKAKEALRLRQGLHGRKSARGVAVSDLQQAAAGNYPDQMADSWAEVYCGGEDQGRGRWVHIHPLYGWINKPENVEGGSIRFGQLAYVVAFSGGGAKDITSRYVADFRLAMKARGPCKQWWENTLRPLRSAEMEATNSYMASLTAAEPPKASQPEHKPSAHTTTHKAQNLRKPTGFKAKEAKARVAREDQELESRIHKQHTEVPSSLEAFKQHKVFILKRHISRYDALRPGAVKAGLHRGEFFYKREDISELHTKDKWVQQGLEVKESELRNPFKVVAKRGSKKNQAAEKDAGDDEEVAEKKSVSNIPADESQQTWLYGRWQCEAWVPPKAEGGVVPKNERGSVHCPPLAACIPEGTRQINRPRIVAICKRLDVDYGMAMTGFDIRGGRSIPRFEGIVVCEEFADQVEQEWEEEQERMAERNAQKRLQEARTTWANLLKAMFMRLGLQTAEAARRQPKKKGKPAQTKKEATKNSGDEAILIEDSDTPAQKGEKPAGTRAKCKAAEKSKSNAKHRESAEKEGGSKAKRGKAGADKNKEAPRPEIEEI